MEKFLSNLKSYFLIFLIFLFPLFFLPFTQEFFITNKLYFLASGGLLLILISTLQFLVSKKLVWQKRSFDYLVLLFLTTIALSILFSSPNKIQALFNPNFGLVMIISLVILYFYLSRVVVIARNEDPSLSLRASAKQSHNDSSGQAPQSRKGIATLPEFIPSEVEGVARNDIVIRIFSFSAFLLSILTIVFYFQPFKNINLPVFLQFLKNPSFTPLGSQLDLAVFLGFFVVYGISRVILRAKPEESLGLSEKADIRQRSFAHAQDDTKSVIFNFSFLTFNLLALFLILYSLLKPSTGLINQAPTLILPPFRLSWYAALEALKNPQTAFFGVGIDNFSSVFTRVKDLAYNQSSLWQINSFSVSRSAVLQIFTETGILGIAAFGLLIFNVMKSAFVKTTADKQLNNEIIKPFIFSFLYLLICLFIFPTSLIIWFLFFVMLGVINHATTQQGNNETMKQSIDFSDLPPLYLGIVVIIFGVIGTSSYFLGRSYASEYCFKKSLDGIVKNNAKDVYDNQRQAVIFNPYIERFRSSFAQTNLLIANNLAQKDPKEITEQDRQTIAQAIQAGIAEGKAVVSLNPQRAGGWQNLASIYMNVINVAEGADVWTISAYQRAIIMDPQNPLYRVDLGGVYYYLGKYDEAVKFFEQAISLKPDWPNANYNYAWANFQKTNYPQAVNAMQNVLSLLDPKLNKADYEKAQKDLEEFKKMLPAEKEAIKTENTKPGTLALPSPPFTQISPKLELPKEASPEAK